LLSIFFSFFYVENSDDAKYDIIAPLTIGAIALPTKVDDEYRPSFSPLFFYMLKGSWLIILRFFEMVVENISKNLIIEM